MSNENLKKTQDVNSQCMDMMVQIKQDCYGQLEQYKNKVHEFSKLPRAIENMHEHFEMRIDVLNESMLNHKNQQWADLMDLNQQFQSYVDENKKKKKNSEVNFKYAMDVYSGLEKDVKNMEYYLNYILPVKQISQVTNLIHSTLGTKDKHVFEKLVLEE